MPQLHFCLKSTACLAGFIKVVYICRCNNDCLMEKQVRLVNNQFVESLYGEESGEGRTWSDDDLLFIRMSGRHPSRVFMSGQPFQQDDTFVCLVMEGAFDCVVNLQRRHLCAGDLLLVTPGSILQAEGDVGEFLLQALHLSDPLMTEIFAGKMPPMYHQRMNGVLIHPSEQERRLAIAMLDTLWLAVHSEYKENRNAELYNFLLLISNMSLRCDAVGVSAQSRNVQVFNRFVRLVNAHCERHRDMEFYADKICLNKQYLSSIISEVSHRTASSWIEEALITRIKILLRHDTLTVNEISDRFGFSEPSNLTRYFKRTTGMTPLEYRNAK